TTDIAAIDLDLRYADDSPINYPREGGLSSLQMPNLAPGTFVSVHLTHVDSFFLPMTPPERGIIPFILAERVNHANFGHWQVSKYRLADNQTAIDLIETARVAAVAAIITQHDVFIRPQCPRLFLTVT